MVDKYYIPIMQRGSAIAVTQKSAKARLTMNSFPDLLTPFTTAETKIMRVFPQVPTSRAVAMVTM